MKALAYIVFLIFLSAGSIKAQSLYGFKQIQFDSVSTENSFNLIDLENGYHAVFYVVRNGSTGKRFIVGNKIDDNTLIVVDMLKINIEPDEITMQSTNAAFFDKSTNSIVIPSAMVDSMNSDADGALCLVNVDHFTLESISFHEDADFNVIEQSRELPSGDLVHVGHNLGNKAEGNIWLLKTNNAGDVLWNKFYGTSEFEFGYAITTDKSGNIYLGGNSRGYGNKIGFYGDAILIKVDSTGEELWRRTWGGAQDESPTSMIVTEDGHLLTVGYVTPEPSSSFEGYVMGEIRKWDSNGNLVWKHVVEWYGGGSTEYIVQVFSAVKPLGNDRYIAVGEGVERAQVPTGVNFSPIAFIFNGDGEILMKREYLSILDSANEAVLLDVLALENGEFIGGGIYFDNERGGAGYRDIFLLKLDENGCEYEACQPALAVEELEINATDFSAYPNPFDQSLTFDTGNRPGRVYVYDIRGVLITQTVVGEQQAQIQGNQMSPGVYIAVFEGVDKSRSSIKIIRQ